MKRTGARAADRKGKDVEEHKPQTERLNVSFEQIEDRAVTKTELLVNILHRPQTHYLRHWGLNE